MKRESLVDLAYKVAGVEMARKEYQPGPMAKAVAKGKGNRDLVQSLYVKFRCEEIVLALEAERAKMQAEALRKFAHQQTTGIFECPCGFNGKGKKVERGNIMTGLLLSCFCLIPGILYGISASGYRVVCPSCGQTLVERCKK